MAKKYSTRIGLIEVPIIDSFAYDIREICKKYNIGFVMDKDYDDRACVVLVPFKDGKDILTGALYQSTLPAVAGAIILAETLQREAYLLIKNAQEEKEKIRIQAIQDKKSKLAIVKAEKKEKELIENDVTMSGIVYKLVRID